METALADELPPAPSYFPKAEKVEWTEIVAAYPPDRFPRATWPMLEGYVRHTIHARRISEMIDQLIMGKLDADLVRQYDRLLIMLDRETKAIASFGVRLGIARTSMAGRHNDDPDRVASSDPLPWTRKV
jgi:hypothetical protein